MLTLIYGNDSARRRISLDKELEARTKEGSVVVAMSDIDFREDFFQTTLEGNSLFGEHYTVVLSGTFENEDAYNIIRTSLKKCAHSENNFIVVETKVLKDALSAFEKVEAKIISCDSVSKKEKPSFSIFSLADAIGARNRKNAWILLREALDKEIAPEEIHGVIFWEIKTLLLAHSAKKETATSSGLNPFVYKKSSEFARKFSIEELEKMSHALVVLYHDAHRGALDLEVGLEQFILNTL
jgi:DNA polymerase III delta subunit